MTPTRSWLPLLLAMATVVPAPSVIGGVVVTTGDTSCGTSPDCCCGPSEGGPAWDGDAECPCATPAPALPEAPSVLPARGVAEALPAVRLLLVLPRTAAGPLMARRPCERPRPSARLALGIRLL